MIDDIVELPRRLEHAIDGADISSEACYSRPISCISRVSGYESHHDDEWKEFGSAFTLPGGKDALFRYKIIECLPKGICEFFCVSEGPINILYPNKSKRAKLYCLWVTYQDFLTMRIRKYVLWRNVRELTRFEVEDSVVDAPIEAVIADEIRSFARLYGADDLLKSIEKYPKDVDSVLISEVQFDPESSVDKLQMLGSNMEAFHDLYDDGDMFSPYLPIDIFRGVHLPEVWTDTTPIKISTVLPFVMFGSVTIAEIIHLFSPAYRFHNFQRSFRKKLLTPDVQTHLPPNDYKELFKIIKYAEALPYSEFELRIERSGRDFLKVTNHDGQPPKEQDNQLIAKPVIKSIRKSIESGFQGFQSATIVKSWEECIYITVVYNAGRKEEYFFDLASASICSRSLLKDYDRPSFSLGI